MKPYFERDGIVLFHGDCREILPGLGKVDAVVTDPPYGISHASNHGASWSGTQIANDKDSGLRDHVIEWAAELNIPVVCFGSWKVSRPSGARGVLIWDKGPAFGMGDLSFPWKLSWEEIYVIGRGFTGSRDEGVIRGHIVVSWESKGRCHPHEKPVTLLEYLIGKCPGSTILDPFAGSCTTLVAAWRLGRKAIGIELSEAYCKIGAARLNREMDQGRLFKPEQVTFTQPSLLT